MRPYQKSANSPQIVALLLPVPSRHHEIRIYPWKMQDAANGQIATLGRPAL